MSKKGKTMSCYTFQAISIPAVENSTFWAYFPLSSSFWYLAFGHGHAVFQFSGSDFHLKPLSVKNNSVGLRTAVPSHVCLNNSANHALSGRLRTDAVIRNWKRLKDLLVNNFETFMLFICFKFPAIANGEKFSANEMTFFFGGAFLDLVWKMAARWNLNRIWD